VGHRKYHRVFCLSQKALQKFEAKMKKSREEGQRPENKSKNRYKNILPCEFLILSVSSF